MKLSIKQKFFGILSLVIVATMVSGLVSLATVRGTAARLKDLEENRLQSLLLARDARAAFQTYNKDIEVALSTHEPSILGDDQVIIAGIHANLDRYSRINTDFETKVEANLDIFVGQAQKFLALRTDTTAAADAFVLAGSQLNQQRLAISTDLARLEAVANAAFQSHLGEIWTQNSRNTSISIGLIAVITLITVAIAGTILTHTLSRIRRIGLHFTGTDIDKIDALTNAGSGDELTELANAANRMLLGIKASRRELVDKKLVDSVMEALVDTLLVTNHAGVIMRSNKAGTQLLRQDTQRLVGMQLFDFLALDLQSQPTDLSQIMARVNAEETVDVQLALKLMGDITIPVRLIGAPLAGGEVGAAAVFVLQDLRQSRAREAELHSAQIQLVQSSKLASLGTMGAGVAHELNNPLTAVLGFAEVISKGTLTPERTKDLTLNIIKAALRMRKIVDHLRVFSADTSRLEKKPISLNTVIHDSLILLNNQFVTHRIAINIKLQDNLPLVLGDANQLESVIQNLLTNARDAFADTRARRAPEITIESWTTDQGLVAIAVSDNGQGIKEADRARIFDPFFTTKEVAKGTGLGLSITHSILKDHAGTLDLTTKVGEGTRFTLSFPSVQGSHLQVQKQEEEVVQKSAKIQRRRSILIIDDEEMIGDVLSMMLGQDYDVAYVNSPQLGCERFLAQDFDLLITDVRMPVMNGIEVIQKIRAVKPNAQILVITGHAQTESEVTEAIQAGALGVIPKPFPSQAALLQQIALALNPKLAATG